jgi:hypothetical protein
MSGAVVRSVVVAVSGAVVGLVVVAVSGAVVGLVVVAVSGAVVGSVAVAVSGAVVRPLAVAVSGTVVGLVVVAVAGTSRLVVAAVMVVPGALLRFGLLLAVAVVVFLAAAFGGHGFTADKGEADACCDNDAGNRFHDLCVLKRCVYFL